MSGSRGRVPDWGNRRYKGPETGMCLRNRNITVCETEWLRGQIVRDDMSKRKGRWGTDYIDIVFLSLYHFRSVWLCTGHEFLKGLIYIDR